MKGLAPKEGENWTWFEQLHFETPETQAPPPVHTSFGCTI